jgi:hypothetical protein
MSITTRIQANPEISTDNAAFVTELIDRAKQIIVERCRLPIYPSLSQGYSQSAASPATSITGISTNKLLVSVNGSPWQTIEITLANCDTGANAASELQTQIRANGTDGFDEVTVAYSNSLYTFTSGRYGEDSRVNLGFTETDKHVCQNLKLGPLYGGVEYAGGKQDDELDAAVVMLVEAMYAKAGMEGVKSGTMLGGLTFTREDWPPEARAIMNARRRLWT